MAQLVLGLAGAAIGSAFGAPGIGWAIGASIGGMVGPRQRTEGPRLTDLRVSAAELGAAVPVIYGHPRTAGVAVWASDKREIATTTRQGKGGGPESTSYTYEVDVLYLLSANLIAGVRRIWADGKLVYSVAAESDDETIDASEDAVRWRGMRVYTGADDQLPDPTYEAAVGVGNATAYRGRGSIMLEGVQLGSGGQLPNLTFEIYCEGTSTGFSFADDFLAATPAACGYLTIAGSGEFFAVADRGDVGRALLCPRVNSTPQYSEIKRTFVAVPARTISYLFRIEDEGDDFSAAVRITGNSLLAAQFYPRAPNDLPLLQAGGSDYYLTGAPLLLNVWHELRITLSDGQERVEVLRGSQVVGTRSIPNASWDSVEISGFGLAAGQTVFTNPGIAVAQLRIGKPGKVTLQPTPLADVVTDLCALCGIGAGDIDVSALAGQEVHTVAMQPTAARAVLEQLATAYYFECVESDKLYFRRRGAAPVATIPYGDYGADGLLTLQDANDLELPAQVNVSYLNLSNAYQQGNEVSDRITTDSTAVSSVQLGMGLTPAVAKAIADTAVLDQTVAARTGSATLDVRYARLEPTDVVLLTDSAGLQHRARIVKIADADGMRSLDLVADDARVLRELGITSDDYDDDYTVMPLADTDLVVLDIPILRDQDDNAGLYAAGDGLRGRWPGYLLLRDGTEVSRSATGAAMGVVAEALGNWASLLVDETNIITVTVNPRDELVSITHADLSVSTSNYAAIGAPGRWEIVQYQRAALVSEGVYRVSGIARGRLGTEHLRGMHQAGDRFVALDGAGLLRDVGNVGDLGIPRTYKAVTQGARIDDGTTVTATPTWQGLRPLAPVGARQLKQGNGDIVLQWGRRSRYVGNVLMGVVPLGEASEAYEIDILSGVTAVRTLASNTSTATYTVALQMADFGAQQATVSARIYQLSASIGRGQPASL